MSNPIGWCDKTWNPITGCSPVSPACDRCYAQRMAYRLAGRYGYPEAIRDPWGNQVPWGAFRPTFHPDKLDEPLRWRKPQTVFVCSMGDLFHEDVPWDWLWQVFGVMALCQMHSTFLLLTKRPQNALRFFSDPGNKAEALSAVRRRGYVGLPLDSVQWPLPKVWLGVTAEDQQRADERIPILLATPAAKRFVSVEPCLSEVDLATTWNSNGWGEGQRYYNALSGDAWYATNDGSYVDTCHVGPRLNQVICGPENGPGKRPMELDWARSLQRQCADAGVPFWYKGGLLDGREWREKP